MTLGDKIRKGIERTITTHFDKSIELCGAREEMYLKIRHRSVTKDGDKTVQNMPISPRQLESAVRLAKAHTRARLRDKLHKKAVKAAIDILQFTLGQVSTDFITGEVDIDVIETGISAGKRKLQDVILEILTSKKEPTAIEDIMSGMTGDIPASVIEATIEIMKTAGMLFEPRHGFLKAI